MKKVLTTKQTLETLKEKLDNSNRVFYLRYGDADFWHMNQRDTRNHKANASLAKELKEGINIFDDDFMCAVAASFPDEPGMKENGLKASQENHWLVEQLKTYDKNFKNRAFYYNPLTFLYLSWCKPDLFNTFFDYYIRPRKKIFIGGTPLEKTEKLYGHCDYYIKTPFKNAYSKIDEIWEELQKYINLTDLIIVSLGQSSRVIGKRLWESNWQGHCLDIGSIVDAACGLETRSWIRKKGHVVRDQCLIKD